VNYSPLYYLVNGVAFSKSNSAASLFPVATTGNVLVRIVNAGLRMHVPSIVGSMTTPLVVTTAPRPLPNLVSRWLLKTVTFFRAFPEFRAKSSSPPAKPTT